MLPSTGLYGRSRNAAVLSMALLAGYLLLAVAGWVLLKFVQHGLMLVVSHGLREGLADASTLVAEDLATTWYLPLIIVLTWWLFAMLLHKTIVQCLTGAASVTRAQEPRLYTIVENTAIMVGLPMPDVDVIETPARNAYASGLLRNGSTVTVTRGLLDALDDRELAAVVAHEVAHILNGDARVMLIATVFNGLVTFIAEFLWFLWGRARSMVPSFGFKPGIVMVLLFLVGGPLLLILVLVLVGSLLALGVFVGAFVVAAATVFSFMQFVGMTIAAAISRLREHVADAQALEITHDADGLISALEKISGHERITWLNAGMSGFMFADPASGSRWLATHPPVSARIAAIDAMRSKYAVRPKVRARSSRAAAQARPAVVFGRRR